ncbi:thiamine phosphate synthase [Spelaeicoccus albus]|uniref:Thiamine-phosphate synthase n=1 Tax=Spelaeicoccus albus TaxID=1280376 RepID=A0A7Z0A8V1_9MICO|nr:thiamine phosphate synthase [Spelaeicoccus albus]NYI65761.1 thiamine-phosphate diphosphorylase [Spelaeicoccus albus]
MTAAGSGIYLVTDAGQCGRRGVVATVGAAIDGGVRTIQVRNKSAGGRELFDEVTAVADAAGDRAFVLVDDRVDVYLAARAAGAAVHGVHVGQDDLPVELVREIVGPQAVVGLTANSDAHAAAALRMPPGTVDYLGVGAIRATSTKPDHPTPLGVAGFARFAATASLPCVAIGGIGRADVPALKQAGAAGVAVVSAICASTDPERAARDLVTGWAS